MPHVLRAPTAKQLGFILSGMHLAQQGGTLPCGLPPEIGCGLDSLERHIRSSTDQQLKFYQHFQNRDSG